MPLIALSLFVREHGTDVSVGVQLLRGETLVLAKTPLVIGGT